MKHQSTKTAPQSRLKAALSIALVGCALFASGCGGNDQEKAEAFVEKGLLRLESQNIEAAKIEFTNAIRLDPNSQSALYHLALIQEREKNWPEFERLLTKLVEVNPEHIQARLRLTNFYLGINDLNVARTHAEYLTKIAANETDAQLTYAAFLFKSGEAETARGIIEQVLDNHPSNIDALFLKVSDQIQQKDFDSASVTLEHALETYPDNLALNMSQLQVYRALEDWPGMVEVYRHLANLFPQNSAPVTSLAAGFAQRGDIDKAIEILESYAQETRNPNYFLQTVDLTRQIKGVAEAEATLKRYIQDHPDIDALPLALADLYSQTDRVADAVKLLKSLLKSTELDEVKLECHIRLGTLAFVSRDVPLAKKHVASALDINEKYARAAALRGTILLYENQDNEAIKVLRTALRDNPDSNELLIALGKAHEKIGKFDLAEEYYNKALKAAPNDISQNIHVAEFLIQRGRVDYADRLLTPLYRQGITQVKVLALLTQVRIAQKDWNSGQRLVDQIRTSEGESPRVLMLQSDIYLGQEKLDKAIPTISQLTPFDQPNLAALRKLVGAMHAKGDDKAAIEYLEKVSQQSPDFIPAYYLQGQLYEQSGQFDRARETYEAVIKRDTKQLNAHIRTIQIRINQQQFEAAQTAIKQAEKALPDSAEITLMQAILYKNKKEPEKSIATYEQLLKAHPDFDIAANNLAAAYLEKGGEQNLAKAAETANRFRQTNNPVFADTLGWIYVQQGNVDEGLALLRRAADKLPQVAEVQYHLGIALARADKPSLAKRQLESALAIANEKGQTPDWLSDAQANLEKFK